MFFGSPIPNRSQTYSLKYFSYPKSSTCSANLNSGGFGKTKFRKYFSAKLFFKENSILYYTHGMIIGQKFWIKEKEYKSWRIYFIFRALANNRQNPIKAKSKTHKSFCQPTFYHYLSLWVLCHENQGVTCRYRGCSIRCHQGRRASR